MPRTAAPRRVRNAVLAGTSLLAVAAVYGVSQQASASATDAAVPAASAPAAGAAATTIPRAGTTAQAAPAGTPASDPARTAAGPAAGPSTAPSGRPSQAAPTQRGVLKPTELPDSTRQQWKPTSDVKSLPLSGDFQLNECVTVQKATAWKQQGYLGSSRETIAVQDTLTFADEATAVSAYRQTLEAMKNCQATSRALQKQNALPQDATVRETATTAESAAWQRRWTGVQGLSSPGDQANHVYAVQRGSVLAFLHFDEVASPNTAPSYDFRGDAAVLRTLGAQLDK
ncbi:hypothetical protein [Streptomyces sp. NPDC096033]|uniref:hypothetical protein n=1 Tax=Streptomyces sp. NPDC096033 TaxID=3366071 RepID=UPI0037F3277B